jgi:hypothetical protein
MTLLTLDPVTWPTANLLSAKPAMTIINGEIVWRAP